MARSYTNVCMQTLGGYVNSPEIENEIKIQAIKILFDRGYGRPVSKTEVTGEDGGDIKITIRNIIAEAQSKK